jgi:ABC-type multidrug transport system fused ATPase/permease subunit
MEGLGIGLLIPVLASLQAPAFDAHPGVATWLTRYADLFQPRLRLPALCATILVVICTKSLLTAVNHRYVSWVDGRISHGIRVELARRLMHVGFRFFVNHDSGRLLHIISSDSWRASAAVAKPSVSSSAWSRRWSSACSWSRSRGAWPPSRWLASSRSTASARR